MSHFLAIDSSLGAQVQPDMYIYVTINWQLSKQGIRWPAPPDLMADSEIDPPRSSIFLGIRWQDSSFQMIAGSSSIF